VQVEIGGDCQSTDGTEPSHMHNRDELSCSVDRGYELWLLQQAKLRNPNLVTYALSWGVPAWVGNGTFFSTDNQNYMVLFAGCVRQELGFDLDYIGIWNERSWGSVDYVLGLRAALDSAGFTHTQIALPDGLGGQVTSAIDAAAANSSFRAAVHAVGLHYPCHDAEPRVAAEGLAYWASEDYSTVADWAGAGCWGRSLGEWASLRLCVVRRWPTHCCPLCVRG
jgi:galactosylceramidase